MKTNLSFLVYPLVLSIVLSMLTSCSQQKEQQATSRNAKLYDGSWESLQKMPIPQWFNDGKIGIFIHWGPYSVMGHRKDGRGYSEHVPKLLYKDTTYYYPYLRKRWGANPPEFGYKDMIPKFKAEKWNPDEWAKLFADVGAKYVVFTAEHHDGWANWDSDLTPWNAMDKGPRRDLVGDLGKALKKYDLKYAPSYHRERHTSFFTTEQYKVNVQAQADVVEEIKQNPEAASLYGPFGFSKEAVDEYVARWKEIQNKYQPDMLWVDDIPIFTRDGNNSQVDPKIFKPTVQYLYDQCRLMITDFMNNAAANGQAVYVNNKGKNRNWPDGVGCLEKDNLKLEVIGPKWQSCTTFGTSFGYLEGDTYKSIEGVIHEMIEVISRNGNFLINIGPKADGTLVPEQVERLKAMGEWLQVNGEAIYGTRYWKENAQEQGHLAFTTKGEKLYAIALQKPETPFTIEGTKDWNENQIKSVSLLGTEQTVQWEMTAEGLQITPPSDLGASKFAWSFEIVTDSEQHTPNAIEGDVDKAFDGTKKVNLEGAHAGQAEIKTVNVSYSEVTGIGEEKGVARRDPTDIIKVGDLYYVWYSRGPIKSGYNATVWYATSKDGRNWTEQGMALGKGKPGSWEGESVFTANILVAEGRYWLFYSGVSKKFGKGFSPDTKIGLAVSESPNGPWERLASNPILTNSEDPEAFDSHLIDDACLVVRGGKYFFYYKGRKLGERPNQTKMGVAIAGQPEGPYVKYEGNPVLKGNHEVLVWPQGKGVAALTDNVGPPELVESVLYAEDGLHFVKTHKVDDGPNAPGAFRSDNFSDSKDAERIQWGLGHGSGVLPFLQRFDLEWPD